MAERGCRVVADTCVFWVAMRGEAPLRDIADCVIRVSCLTHAVAYDMGLSGEEELLEWARARVGPPRGPRVSALKAVLGRYGRRVREIGAADVMIALTARELDALLATCDWRLAQFYMSLTGKRPVFIPAAVRA
ncbi:MAG: hypothetical protein GSR80_001021 [Desulfurococcales archaeon]|nr:hypothetical protein [Desulfurococcales archaeon]